MKLSHRIAITLTSAVLFGAILSTATAHAQYYSSRPYYRPHSRVVAIYPEGLYVGGGVIGTRVLDQRGGAEVIDSGAGFALYTGLRVNRTLALEAGWIGTLHNPEKVQTNFGEETDYLILNGFTADAKIYLSTGIQNVEPFLQGGVGLYLLDSEYFGAQSVGTGFQAGGGFDFRVGGKVLLGARVLYRGMAMGPPDGAESDTFVSAATAEGNLTIQF